MNDHTMTLFLANGRQIQVPYDAELMELQVDGIGIRNPFRSPCGRFYVSPTQYGFKVDDFIGASQSYTLTLPNEDYMVLTTSDGHLPDEEADAENAIMGRYTPEGEELAQVRMANVPTQSEQDDEEAPGPVQLPARIDMTKLPTEQSSRYHIGKRHGWNACLDEMAKLGPLYTGAAAGDVEKLRLNHRKHAARLIDERGRMRELHLQRLTTILNSLEAANGSVIIDTIWSTGSPSETLFDFIKAALGGDEPVREKIKAALLQAGVPDLCEDEGCPHHGTKQVCVNLSQQDPGKGLRYHLEMMIGQAEFMLEQAENLSEALDVPADEDEDPGFDECREYIAAAKEALAQQVRTE